MRSMQVIGAGDVEPAHFVLEGGALQPETLGGAAAAGHFSRATLRGFDDRLPLSIMEGRDWRTEAWRRRHQLVERHDKLIALGEDDAALDKVLTFGFNTAVSFATECIDRLHSTALSHQLVIVVEVMGRYAGWIALQSGLAGRVDAILIPEIPYDIEKLAAHLRYKHRDGKPYSIIVVAKGAKPLGGDVSVRSRELGRAERLGGIGETVAAQLQELTSKESRCVVELRSAAAAIQALSMGMDGVMVALNPPRIDFVPIQVAIAKLKLVPQDSDFVLVSRALDISFGDGE